MTKPELGVKRDCPECGTRFYDLNKEPAHCPQCDNEFVPEVLLKPRKPRREDEPAETADKPAKTSEVPLEAAEKEQKAPESKRKPALDGEEDEDEIDELKDLGIEIEDDEDDDDDTLLDDDDSEDDDVKGIVSGSGDQDV